MYPLLLSSLPFDGIVSLQAFIVPILPGQKLVPTYKRIIPKNKPLLNNRFRITFTSSCYYIIFPSIIMLLIYELFQIIFFIKEKEKKEGGGLIP